MMLTPWKESYDQPRQHIKSRDITLLTKARIVKAMVFSVVRHRYGSCTIKKAECLNCGAREDLRVLWTARRSNQSTLKEVSPE